MDPKILELQKLLKAAGHDPKGLDGIFGKDTRSAIISFQREKGLEQTGDPNDPILMEALVNIRATNVSRLPFLNREFIMKVCASAKPELVEVLTTNDSLFIEAGITNKLRLAHFMSQIATETGGLRRIEENLNYTTARRILDIWPSRFSSTRVAEAYVRNPEKLANKVYGGRLGNIDPGDGWEYRGGGMMQTTGRANYRRAGFEENPEELRKPLPALKSALSYWAQNNINNLADQDDLVRVRRAVNGGTIGIEETRLYLSKAKRALGI